MEKVYRNSALLVVLIIFGVQWGFYKTYTSQFPEFPNVTYIIHLHGAALMAWLVMLVVQPLLIATGRNQLHRKLGQLSWVLGPFAITMLFLVGRGAYYRVPDPLNTPDFLSTMVLDIRGFLSFAIFWALAMVNRKEHNAHMRYMLATGLLGIGPGVARGLMYSFDFSLMNAILVSDTISLLIVGVMLGYDIARKKNLKPLLTVFLVLLAGTILWIFSNSGAWLSFARWYAGAFY